MILPKNAYGVVGSSHGRRESGFEQEEDVLDDTTAQDSAVMARLNQQIARRRIGALACACLLSIGSYVLFFPSSPPFLAHSLPANSHYSTYTLGPIKKDLHTSEGHFAALLSALELASTLTPLLSGFLIPRYGAAAVGLIATGAIFLGQLIVCAAFSREGGVNENLGAMVCSLFLLLPFLH
jgi:MFS family permease